MLSVTYKNYSKLLNKTFINTKEVQSIPAFKLFAQSLNLDYKIVSWTTINNKEVTL